jgi:hypothetical protein
MGRIAQRARVRRLRAIGAARRLRQLATFIIVFSTMAMLMAVLAPTLRHERQGTGRWSPVRPPWQVEQLQTRPQILSPLA